MATSVSPERYTAEAKSVMVRSHAGRTHTGRGTSWLCSVWDSTGVSQPGLSASPAHTVSGAYPKAAPGLAGFDSSCCSSLLERLVCPVLSFVETADLRDEVYQGSGVRTNT